MRLLLAEPRQDLLASLGENQGRWRRFLQKRAPRGIDVDDLLQDALVRAARTSSPPTLEKRDAWFYRILRNVVIDATQSHDKAPVQLDETRQLPASFRADLDGAREGERPWTCECDDALVAGLAPGQATLLRRVHVEGEAVGPVAHDLGLTTSAAYVALHRARQKLRVEIAELCGATDYDSARACACAAEGCAVDTAS